LRIILKTAPDAKLRVGASLAKEKIYCMNSRTGTVAQPLLISLLGLGSALLERSTFFGSTLQQLREKHIEVSDTQPDH